MLHIVRAVVDALTTVSVVISLVTYYLAANKQWQVKHERAVAASISVSSNGLYLVTTLFFALNMMLTSAPWQTEVETALALVNTVFLLAIGISLWVPGERPKGVWRLLRESLRSERRHLGALAKAMTHPWSSRAIIYILARVAAIDGVVDAREKAFIELFASSWGIRVDWTEVDEQGELRPEQKYARLRRGIADYLAAEPPKTQALQLADLLLRLVQADGRVTETEALIVAELGAHLQQYAEEGERVLYEVHLVPQSQSQADAMSAAFPRMKRRVLPSGSVGVAATCYSPEYAETVRDQYAGLEWYTAVTRVTTTGALPQELPSSRDLASATRSTR
ncbi:MAG: TerB family tellurite resistance protein [Polyangiaceae bacterium]